MKFPMRRLGEVARLVRETTEASNLKENAFYLGLEHIESGGKIIGKLPITSGMIASSKFKFTKDHVLFGKLRPYLAKIATPDFDGYCSTDILPIEPGPDLNKSFLAHFLLQPETISLASSLATGANLPRLSPKTLMEFKIPIPPIEEQKRIADILDKAESLRAKRREAISLINSLTQSIFLEMFGNPATNPKGWNLAPIGSFLESASYGSSQKAGDTGKWPILRMNNLTYSGEMDFSNLKYLDLIEKDIPKYTVKKGDILFNRTNSAELVGKTAVYNEDGPMAFAGYLVRLRCTEDNHAEYISAVLNSEWGKSTLRGMCKSIIGMANINATEIQKLVIPKPPGELQKKFGAKVSILKTHKGAQMFSMRELDDLFASIQQKAFSGQL